MNQQLKSVVAEWVHFHKHAEALEGAHLAVRYKLLPHLPNHSLILILFILFLIFENLVVACWNTILIKKVLTPLYRLIKPINASLVTILQEEIVAQSKEADAVGFGYDSKYKLRVVENGVLPDVVTLLERFEHVGLPLFVHDFEVDFAIHDEINILAVFIEAQYLVALLIYCLLHMILDLFEEVGINLFLPILTFFRLKIINLLE